MATAAAAGLRTDSEPHSALSSAPSADFASLTWTRNVRSRTVLPHVLFDSAVILANGIWLLLLFEKTIGVGALAPSAGLSFTPADFGQHLGRLLLYVSLTLLTCSTTELYDETRAFDHRAAYAVITPVLLSTILFALCLLPMHVDGVYWSFVAALASSNVIGLISWRLIGAKVAASRNNREHKSRRVLIIGAGGAGRRLGTYLQAHSELGYTVRGFLDDSHSADPMILGATTNFLNVVRSEFIDDVFITDSLDLKSVQNLTDEAQECGVDVRLIPDVWKYATSWECVGDVPVMVIRSKPIPKVALFLKRAVDIVGASMGLITMLPLLVAISMLIRLDSPGPALYRAWRVGEKGVRFKCVKFRTMTTDADRIKDQLRSLNQRQGATFKIKDDPRITRVGRCLRKYSLDELPQLWNVVRGEMSLVGPRPHPLDDYNQYALEHRLRLRVTPGLTGLWQITARTDPSFERNVALDLEYIRHWSFWMDIKILLGTLPAVLRGEGQ